MFNLVKVNLWIYDVLWINNKMLDVEEEKNEKKNEEEDK